MASVGRGWAFKLRVSILLSVLLVLLLYATLDWLGRRERTKWERPLNVALIVVQQSTVPGSAIGALRERIPKLEAQLDGEFHRSVVEGDGEQGGRVGVARVELADDMIDFALFVATHELFHNLGATDKYGESGHTLVPAGLAEPELSPTFPQRMAEVMARNRPLGDNDEVPPTSLDQLGVGPMTAAEIGWAQ